MTQLTFDDRPERESKALQYEGKTNTQVKKDAVLFARELYSIGDWFKASEMFRRLGWTGRYQRLLKEELPEGEIISGNKGYKHAAFATEEEWKEYWDRMVATRKRIDAAIQKSYAYYHKIHGRKREE